MSSSSVQPSVLDAAAIAHSHPRLAAAGLHKRFPGVRALDNVSLQVWPGEVLAVVGENGAGKSTLMRILAGNQRPDRGSITVEGSETSFASPAEAMRHGIVLIHQELNLADNLTIAENIVLGREPSRYGWMNRQAARERAAQWLDKVGLKMDPATSLRSLSIAQKQMVEIAKALSTSAIVLIMDEPTSSLSQQESERLFGLVEELRQSGVSIVYISHRLGEVVRLADRVEVLRDGRSAGSLIGDAIEHDAMVKLMIGRDTRPLAKPGVKPAAKPGVKPAAKPAVQPGLDIRLEVRNLVVQLDTDIDRRPPASFVAHGGEVVVLAGLVGAGRSELLETMFGIRPSTSGTIHVDKQRLERPRVGDSIAAGMALVSEDRKATGLLVESTVRTNTTIAALNRNPLFPFCGRRWEATQTAQQIDALGIKTASQHTTVSTLSGGNQQKVAIAKWLIYPPRVLLLDEPTRGVDIAARQEIYHILLKLAAENVAIVIASSDMEEVIAIADRVLVMHQGKIMGELTDDDINEPNIMQLAVGRELTRAILVSPSN